MLKPKIKQLYDPGGDYHGQWYITRREYEHGIFYISYLWSDGKWHKWDYKQYADMFYESKEDAEFILRKAAPISKSQNICPDCKGTGIYVGLFEQSSCKTCQIPF